MSAAFNSGTITDLVQLRNVSDLRATWIPVKREGEHETKRISLYDLYDKQWLLSKNLFRCRIMKETAAEVSYQITDSYNYDDGAWIELTNWSMGFSEITNIAEGMWLWLKIESDSGNDVGWTLRGGTEMADNPIGILMTNDLLMIAR